MILKGTQRANGGQLAAHLLNIADNDQVTVHEVRGFISETLLEAFKEAFAISRGTKCKQYLFSVSLSPPMAERVAISHFKSAITKIEEAMGLEGQPRAVVFHEKKGRRHAHCVWSRIDVENMTAINLAHSKLKLRSVSQELYLENRWQMPKGLLDRKEACRLNYTREEAQQTARQKIDASHLKASLRDCWVRSDCAQAFEQALARKGYCLARGDRRGFVLVNRDGEVFSASRWIGVKTSELSAKLGDCESYPTIEQARSSFIDESNELALQDIREIRKKFEAQRDFLDTQATELRRLHQAERQQLAMKQKERLWREAMDNHDLLRSGLLGLWDRVTGRDKKCRQLIAERTQAGTERDRNEELDLIQRQLGAHQYLQEQIKRLDRETEQAVAALVDEMVELSEDQQSLVSDPRQKLKFDFSP